MIVCADDYGLAEDIDRAILELVDQGLVSAVSCLVASPRLTLPAVAELTRRAGRIDLGLHLGLTDEAAPLALRPAPRLAPQGRFGSFGRLLIRAYLHRLDPAELRAEAAAQHARFVDLFGRPPDFVDSHLHVHQLPLIRRAVVDFLAGLAEERRPWVRTTAMGWGQVKRQGGSRAKATLVALPGRALAGQAGQAGLAVNDGFAGVYSFGDGRAFPDLLDRFLAELTSPRSLLVVHPGLVEDWRRVERATLLARRPGPVNRFAAKE